MSQPTYPYARILNAGPPFGPTDDSLDDLAKFMSSEPDPIPAGYTYLGQFINHDITLELSAGSNPLPLPPWGSINDNQILNYRSPFLNLDSLYGTPGVVENGFTRDELLDPMDRRLMKLGSTTNLGSSIDVTFPGKDLPRVEGQPKAILVEARNDENLAVAQTHLAFLRFHNAVVRSLDDSVEDPFETARLSVIQHYQWIVLYDYLPKVVKESVLNDVLDGSSIFYTASSIPIVPLEFSVAAFRMGHSMIRESYNWNRVFNHDPRHVPAKLGDLRNFTGEGKPGLVANRLPSDWAINWNWFYKLQLTGEGQMLNMASPIDTRLAPALSPGPYNKHSSLAASDLFRGRAVQLPTGQDVARALLGNSRVLPPEQMDPLLPAHLRSTFSAETPLWFYLLAEAEIEERGARFGEVGSRIVAETIVELIRHSTPTILPNEFSPKSEWRTGKNGTFGMAELLQVISGGQPRELNPLG